MIHLLALVFGFGFAPTCPPTPQQSSATASVTGEVRDSFGATLPGVTLTVTAGKVEFSAVTDSRGRYTLAALPAGSHTIRATLLGFCPGEKRLDLDPGGLGTANFDLQVGRPGEIDWIAPPDKLADLVAKARQWRMSA